jgi:hypothetical protein
MFALQTIIFALSATVHFEAEPPAPPPPVATVKKVAAAVEIQPQALAREAIDKSATAESGPPELRTTRMDRMENERPKDRRGPSPN